MSLSVSLKGPAYVHKSRENPDGTFSIGKTWDLKELTALEVSGVCLQVIALPFLFVDCCVCRREHRALTSRLQGDIDGNRRVGMIKKRF